MRWSRSTWGVETPKASATRATSAGSTTSADPVLQTPPSRSRALFVSDPGELVGVAAGHERADRVLSDGLGPAEGRAVDEVEHGLLWGGDKGAAEVCTHQLRREPGDMSPHEHDVRVAIPQAQLRPLPGNGDHCSAERPRDHVVQPRRRHPHDEGVVDADIGDGDRRGGGLERRELRRTHVLVGHHDVVAVGDPVQHAGPLEPGQLLAGVGVDRPASVRWLVGDGRSVVGVQDTSVRPLIHSGTPCKSAAVRNPACKASMARWSPRRDPHDRGEPVLVGTSTDLVGILGFSASAVTALQLCHRPEVTFTHAGKQAG